MPSKKRSTSSSEKNISITGDVKDSVVIAGDNNTVNQTIIQKFFNIFKSDSETLEQRNRRILLGHVENAWIKGVLEPSLHGAAMLDLEIKKDTKAVIPPLAINNAATNETLPAGTSMLEIFDSIGMGRSLLILGAPGSGKTTMLLELARGLIAHAREDVTYPIPMVFNLASWTEKLTINAWLAQELNNLYSVPRKTAPDWVKGDKLLLLLDGLDEVRQESRAKCVEAINAFRKDHGLTSITVCSRSQDYADLKPKLAFEGAIEVQPLTQKQITEFFNRFGKEMVGIKQVLQKDSALREMAETPLFLGIMILAYRDKQDVEIWVSKKDEKAQRRHLFDTYIERMFERPRIKKMVFKKQDVLHWLSWLSHQMIITNHSFYTFEDMQSNWLGAKQLELKYRLMIFVCRAILIGSLFSAWGTDPFFGFSTGLISSLVISGLYDGSEIKLVEVINWSWKKFTSIFIIGIIFGGCFGWLLGKDEFFGMFPLGTRMFLGFGTGIISGLFFGVINSVRTVPLAQTVYVGQKIYSSIRNSSFIFILTGLIISIGFGLIANLKGILPGLVVGIICGLYFGGFSIIKHYLLRLTIYLNDLLPWKLVPFLDHCVDLIFLRRVGGGYIFVHRLLMEHFAEMYVETPTPKGN